MKILKQQNKHDITSQVNSYVENVLELNNNRLPKSTTCCWILRERNPKYRLYQYFVGIDLQFALNLSSYINEHNTGIGATFMSSVFAHSTSIPIWIDNRERIHLEGPSNMYNFAWGSNGSCREKI